MASVHIYGLHHPITGELRYIGKAVNVERRLQGHCAEKRRRTLLYDWIKTLPERPKATILATVEPELWQATERHWIAQHRALGTRLLNLADGGDQPKPTREQCQQAARAATKARMAGSPLKRKVWELKRRMASTWKTLDHYGRPIDRYTFNFLLKCRVASRPEIFEAYVR